MSDDSLLNSASAAPHKSKRIGPLGAIFFGASAFLMPNVVLLLLFRVAHIPLPFSGNIKDFIILASAEAIMAVTIYVIVRAYGLRLRDIGLVHFKFGYIGYALAGFMVYFLLSSGISLLAGLLTPIDLNQQQDVGFASPKGYEMALVFFGLVVVAPFAEELIFRGFIFTGLRSRFPFWLTAVLVSLLFGLVHGQANVGIDVFALSLVLCFLREKTNSLWAGILLHAIKNTVAFLFLFVYTGL